MLPRSASKPIFLGLATGAVLAAGAAPSAAAPEPSPSGSEGEPKATLSLEVAAMRVTAKPGDTVDIVTTVVAKGGPIKGVKVVGVKPSFTGATLGGQCATPASASCTVGTLDDGESGKIASTVTVPAKLKETTSVKVTVSVEATDIAPSSAFATVKYVVPPKPKPTPTPTKTPKPTLSPGAGDGPSDGKPGKDKEKTGAGSGSGGSGSSGGQSGSGSGSGAGSTYTPPAPNASFTPNSNTKSPQVALPPIAPPSPSVAPTPGPTTPESRLRNNKSPVAQDLTFERMASTQVAWLAALLVAFSLLLTQLRLGRRTSVRSLAAAEAARRARGTHRRPSKGMFGK